MSIVINPQATKISNTLSALRNGPKDMAEGLKLYESAPFDSHGIRTQTLLNRDTFEPLESHVVFDMVQNRNQLQIGLSLEETRQSQSVMFGGREFILSEHINKDSLNLNDPNISVSSTGYLTKTTKTANGMFRIDLLGKAVDAPEWVDPAPKRSEFTTLSLDAFNGSECFARATLDFFTRGAATQADFDRTKASIDNLLKEIAEMRKNGMEDDFSKLQGKIDIMGEQVSLLQLLDMQKEAARLTDGLFDKGIRFGTEFFTEAARHGTIKAMGVEYGNKIGGNIGKMFSAAFAAEADNFAVGVRNIGNHAITSDAHAFHKNALKNGAEMLYDVFAKIDTSSKENAVNSFNALNDEINNALQMFMNQYEGGGSLNGTWGTKLRNDVNAHFNNVLGLIK